MVIGRGKCHKAAITVAVDIVWGLLEERFEWRHGAWRLGKGACRGVDALHRGVVFVSVVEWGGRAGTKVLF